MDDSNCDRSYFTVIDDDGKGHPAVEYLAATLDDAPIFEILPLRRFVRLIGSGEELEPLGEGRFVGSSSRRPYFA